MESFDLTLYWFTVGEHFCGAQETLALILDGLSFWCFSFRSEGTVAVSSCSLLTHRKYRYEISGINYQNLVFKSSLDCKSWMWSYSHQDSSKETFSEKVYRCAVVFVDTGCLTFTLQRKRKLETVALCSGRCLCVHFWRGRRFCIHIGCTTLEYVMIFRLLMSTPTKFNVDYLSHEGGK